jgi:hypothetical protein
VDCFVALRTPRNDEKVSIYPDCLVALCVPRNDAIFVIPEQAGIQTILSLTRNETMKQSNKRPHSVIASRLRRFNPEMKNTI